MKALKKFLAIAAVLIVGMTAASAWDSDSFISQYIGDASYEEFKTTLEEITEDYFLEMLQTSMGDDIEINQFYQLTEDNCNDEDYEMISAVEDYLIEDEGIDVDEIYMVMVIKGIDMVNSSMDAWIVFSHFNEDDEFTHYAYYMAVTL